MVCTHEILTGGGGLVGQVKFVVIKIFFSRGVTLRYAPVKFWPGEVNLVKSNLYRSEISFIRGGGVPQFYTQKTHRTD